jgi:hypothetical protein
VTVPPQPPPSHFAPSAPQHPDFVLQVVKPVANSVQTPLQLVAVSGGTGRQLATVTFSPLIKHLASIHAFF